MNIEGKKGNLSCSLFDWKMGGESVMRDIFLELKIKGDRSKSMLTNLEQYSKHRATNTPDSSSFHKLHCER